MALPTINPEVVLAKEHAARELQRASMFVLNLILAGLVLAVAAVPQLVMQQFNGWLTGAGVAGALFILLSLRIALQWDRAVVLRLGRFHGLHGPGVFWLVPFVDRVARYVD